MANNLEKYPVVQLLDNLNNPVSPAVQVNSIYEDPGSKNSLDLIYKYESATLSVDHLVEGEAEDGGKTIRQKETLSSKQDGSAPDPSTGNNDVPIEKDLYIVTDTWVGDGPNTESSYEVDNTLHVRKYNASDLLEWWFEHDYLSKKAGSKISFGTCTKVPTSVVKDSGRDNSEVIQSTENHSYHEMLHPVVETGGKWYVGRTIDSEDQSHWSQPIYKVIDFNTTNFFAPDKYPRRGTIRPSAEYIWFVIDSANVNAQSVKLYGFSGEDNPQEIDIVPINNMANAWRSVGKFGIDTHFNSNEIGDDGYDYHIFVKYRERV